MLLDSGATELTPAIEAGLLSIDPLSTEDTADLDALFNAFLQKLRGLLVSRSHYPLTPRWPRSSTCAKSCEISSDAFGRSFRSFQPGLKQPLTTRTSHLRSRKSLPGLGGASYSRDPQRGREQHVPEAARAARDAQCWPGGEDRPVPS